MEDKLEKKLKAFLPYIIIIGVVFLLVPALLLLKSDAVAYLVLIGILPLTALLCCAHYASVKRNDFALAFVAPVFFVPAMFLYQIVRDNPINALIYLVAYFLCGYLGLTVGDMLSGKKKGKSKSAPKEAPVKRDRRPAEVRPEAAESRAPERRASAPARPRKVDVEAHAPESFEAVDPYQDRTLDLSTTDDDIDAILREIHQRRSGEF